MGFAITYKTLFEVRLLHHYHLDKAGEGNDYVLFDLATPAAQESMLRKYDVSSFLTIEPTEACAADLRRYKCVFRRMADRIVVAAKVQFDEGLNAYKPFVAPDDALAFSFRYRVTDPFFLNYSNIPLKQEENTIYFFRNTSEGGQRLYPSLTLSAPVRDENEVYNEGEILLSADLGAVLIADRITGPANSPAQNFTSDPKVDGHALRYINRNDIVRTSGNRLTMDTGLQDRSGHIDVSVTDSNALAVSPVFSVFEDGNTIVQLDFSAFQEGLYRVRMEDPESAYTEEVTVYLQKEKVSCDGVIRIHVKSDTAAFSLLNPNGTIKEGNQLRSFELRFKNRATIWRYLGRTLSNEPESGPYLLARSGFVHVTVNDENTAPVNDVPNASVSMIKTEHPIAAPEYYNLVSEIYLNS